MISPALLLATALSAQTTAPIEAAPEVVHKKKTVLIFSTTELSGTVTRPALDYLRVRGAARFAPLIAVRAHFRAELDASLDNL